MNYLLIIGFVWALYVKSIWYGYVVDDNNSSISAQKCLHATRMSWKKVSKIINGAGLFKNTKLDHAFTILLTSIVSCLIYLCWGNIWLALLYACHPMNNQTTLWLNGRRYQLSLILGLLSYKLPILGFVGYPLALWVHPISAPFIILTGIFVTPLAYLWAIPGVFALPKLNRWLQGRWKIQNFELYKRFNEGKPVLATKCLGDYFVKSLFPRGFTMYHPTIWGVAELEGNRLRAYAENLHLYLSIALIASVGFLCAYLGGMAQMGFIIAVVGLIPWIGLWINPTQLWAERYATLSNIGFCMMLIAFADATPFGAICKLSLILWFSIIVLKDMEMYRDVFSFFFKHFIDQPHNQNAAYFGTTGFNNYARDHKKAGNPNDVKIFASASMCSGLLWCMRNKKADLIHDFAGKMLAQVDKKKPQGSPTA